VSVRLEIDTQGQLQLSVAAVYEWAPVGANQHGKRGVEAASTPVKANKELAANAGVVTRTMEQAMSCTFLV